jgi:hypothetical protein
MRILILAGFAAALGCAPLHANEKTMFDDVLNDQEVTQTLQIALTKISLAKCGDSACQAATDEEKAKPPISIDNARMAMKAGLLSGSAEVCGIDWKGRVYQPFLTNARRQHNLNDRQMALTVVLHSLMQGYLKHSFQKQNEPCSDRLRSNIEKQIAAVSPPKAE